MFVLLPLGHEQTSLRRAPWVTIAIAAVCLVLQARACSVESQVMREATAIAEQIDGAGEQTRAALEQQLEATLERMPSMQLGYRPARDGIVAMITYAFAHGGWFHLIGNLLFLYVVGCNMEDRWGRALFLLFYVLGAVVAALAFKLSQPQGTTPLVGASGAVAAAMGAFLVFYGRAQIRFVYAYWILLRPHWGQFQAPAWGALLAWFAQQVLMAWIDSDGVGGVAYMAHVGGFVFGLALAFVLKATGLDATIEKAVGTSVETKTAAEEWQEDPHAEALQLAVDARDVNKIIDNAAGAYVAWNKRGTPERVVASYRAIREQHAELELGEVALRAVIAAAGRKGTDPLVVVDVASQLIRQHPQSALIPRALWIAAEAQEALQRTDLAQRTLHNLVAAFPMEPLTQQARRKLGTESLRPPT